jgi:cytoskeletal protein CcmA (bactofilin family)
VISFVLQPPLTLPDARSLARAAAIACALFCALLCAGEAVSARTPSVRVDENDPTTLIVEGDDTKDVFGMGRNVIVRGRVRHGVMAFGGDVVVEGRVEGDVGVIGGTITQRENSFIGGDVLVIGGAYHHGKSAPGRDPATKTIMFAGYEEELRELGRNPASLLEPEWSAPSFGLRVLSILFWFIISLGLTAASPGAVSRAATRLQLTSLRVAVIGLLAAFVLVFGVPIALHVLPPVLGLFVGALSILLLLVAYLFGRVAIHAATGRWLQRRLLREEQRSESIALLLGATFWAVVLSLPYVWASAVAALVVISLGLALTVRYRIGWKSPARA